MPKPLFEAGADWNFDLIRAVDEECSIIAHEELGVDIYKNQIEIIDSGQMLEVYSSIGLPIMYDHWSFGQAHLRDEHLYRKGLKGLAYELVINSDPCISYLMEENSMAMQTLVIAHACYGHNHFFKNNYLFKQWTSADSIIDYLVFAKNYIAECEERYGPEPVRDILDAAHSIQQYGIDRYKRPKKLNKKEEEERQKRRADYLQKQVNELWSTLPEPEIKRANNMVEDSRLQDKKLPKEPQENLLYFIEKNSPVLQSWEREIVRIVRKLAQYFYPQRQTKVMNEGYASFAHYYILHRMYEKGLLTEGTMLEILHSHSSVTTQRAFNQKGYGGFNPYALGFDMMMDIKRICEEPTAEDMEHLPHLEGKKWNEALLEAVANYRDESFVMQYLSPRVVKKWGMFRVHDEENAPAYRVEAIQNEKYFKDIRRSLSQQYSLSNMMPNIEIVNANVTGSRMLELLHTPVNGERLDEKTKRDVLQYMEFMWGYTVAFQNDVEESPTASITYHDDAIPY